MVYGVFVGIGAFFGAISRFGLGSWINKRYPMKFPIATFLVNMLGSFLLGFIIGNGLPEVWQLSLGTGFMGAFTTFSTFKLENIQLYLTKHAKTALIYIGISYTFGIGLAFIGMKLGGM